MTTTCYCPANKSNPKRKRGFSKFWCSWESVSVSFLSLAGRLGRFHRPQWERHLKTYSRAETQVHSKFLLTYIVYNRKYYNPLLQFKKKKKKSFPESFHKLKIQQTFVFHIKQVKYMTSVIFLLESLHAFWSSFLVQSCKGAWYLRRDISLLLSKL